MIKEINKMEIKTAEEFFDSQVGYKQTEMLNKAIEFAKYHVEEALKQAVKNVYLTGDSESTLYCSCRIDKNSILNSYNLDNIK